jgi:hypothetical protein
VPHKVPGGLPEVTSAAAFFVQFFAFGFFVVVSSFQRMALVVSWLLYIIIVMFCVGAELGVSLRRKNPD